MVHALTMSLSVNVLLQDVHAKMEVRGPEHLYAKAFNPLNIDYLI